MSDAQKYANLIWSAREHHRANPVSWEEAAKAFERLVANAASVIYGAERHMLRFDGENLVATPVPDSEFYAQDQ